MSITVVGSIAYDAVKTPFGERSRMLGGAATHFALAASFFDTVHVVGPVGDDFGAEDLEVLAARGTDVSDVERVSGGRTFFWRGEYGWDLNSRETLATELGVFEQFEPELSAASRDCDVLFLANIQPQLQLSVLEQCSDARLVAMDSMNLWIDVARDALIEVIRRVDCVILNDAELRQLTGRPNLLLAARDVLDLGPTIVVAKQGEYGASLITGGPAGADTEYGASPIIGGPPGAGSEYGASPISGGPAGAGSDPRTGLAADRRNDVAGHPPTEFFALPAYPLETVVDPTGAGDTFAGGFVGHLARQLGELGELTAGTRSGSFDGAAPGPAGARPGPGAGPGPAAAPAAARAPAAAHHVLRQAMAYGTALASYNVEEFGTERVYRLTPEEIRARVDDLQRMTQFEHDPITLG